MVKKIGQRKFLLKRGYFESELDKMSPSEAKRIIASIEKIEHPQGQRKVYSEKEINAIKEFVEWLKDRFNKRIDEQTAKYERIVNEGDDGDYLTSYMEYVANNEGILTGFVNAKWWLEELDTVEKFMEDRNDKGKNN